MVVSMACEEIAVKKAAWYVAVVVADTYPELHPSGQRSRIRGADAPTFGTAQHSKAVPSGGVVPREPP